MAGYHRGERAVQRRAGALDASEHVRRAIRDTVPAVAAEFLARQPVVFVGAEDAEGRLWSTQLTGPPGFLDAPDEHTVTVAAHPSSVDPLADALTRPTPVGMIAIEPGSRRRMRVNGVAQPDGRGFAVEVAQVVSNCPRYIQQRSPSAGSAPPEARACRTDELTAAQRERIGAADTFFVTTAGEGSVDTSHRGGSPGFVRVLSPTALEWPDYPGNAMFLTLGNLEVDHRAALLFPDWGTGSAIHLSGTARVDWSAEHAATHPGAERVVRFEVARVVGLSGASPLTWTPPTPSRFNPVLPGG
ncbi:pyridoxamine 5'-phosphate oxidase family protein [Actinosynnema sp. NPDC020468]|uniref:pyridoxamine 5'-phosphate oxidase family protein n=1 Tax=Actinosynnema sp. NPDC020468 TaxID=3154488 RepID=UPI0033EA0C6A